MKTMAEVLAEHRIDHRHDTALHEQCICGRRWMMGPQAFETHQAAALSAAGFGPVREAGAQALRDAADERATRSEALLKTMQNMAESREYEHADIVRYGSYSLEANCTATWLRARAATLEAS